MANPQLKNKLLIPLLITGLFIFYQVFYPSQNSNDYFGSNRQSHISRIYNLDTTLYEPYANIRDRWNVHGNVDILQDKIEINNGYIITNSVGDRFMDDFEIIMSFRVKESGSIFVLGTEEVDFSSDGLYVDFFNEDIRDDENDSLIKQWYVEVFTIRNNERINITEEKIKIDYHNSKYMTVRLIIFENMAYLKLDIDYSNIFASNWNEVFQIKDLKVAKLPTSVNNQKFTGIKSEGLLDLKEIRTNEFHWEEKISKGDIEHASIEDTWQYINEIQLFLAQEFGQRISMEMNEFKKLKLIKSQPSLRLNERIYNSEHSNKGFFGNLWSLTWKLFILIILNVIGYFISVYFRVAKKHINRVKKHRIRGHLLPE